MTLYLNIWHGAGITVKEKYGVKAFETQEDAEKDAKGGECWYCHIAVPIEIEE